MSSEPDSGYQRLEDQIDWYDKKSISSQRWFKILKLAEIAAAAAIPFFASVQSTITAILGVFVVVFEGIQHLNQYQHNWVFYRSNCESLRHEKYLYLAKSGPYNELDAEDALKELANRVESLISTEHAKWVTSRDSTKKKKG